MQHYNIKKANIDVDEMVHFLLSSDEGLDLSKVPGIGPANLFLLYSNAGITNTYQLYGKFLSLKKKDQFSQQLCDEMFRFLMDKVRIHGCGHEIVTALAEKLDTLFPGFCDMEELRRG